LTVDKKKTSSYKRKLTSAPDNRVSAQSIGYVGIVILTIVGGFSFARRANHLKKAFRVFR
jgi:hypothetical protein